MNLITDFRIKRNEEMNKRYMSGDHLFNINQELILSWINLLK